MIKLGIVGCMGRMGLINIATASEDNEFIISGALEREGHESVGENLSSIVNVNSIDTIITDDIDVFLKNVDTVIDFTVPKSSLDLLEHASKQNKKYILGTTGFTDEEKSLIENYSKEIPILFSSNMSVGMNVLFNLVYQASKILADYDIEIIEKHHNKKKDSPSGSALTLAENVASALNISLKENIKHGREGIVGERSKKEIGMHAIRGGDIVGEHTVLFAGMGEYVTLSHTATSRINFSNGALMAAKWIKDKKNGLYTIGDIIN